MYLSWGLGAIFGQANPETLIRPCKHCDGGLIKLCESQKKKLRDICMYEKELAKISLCVCIHVSNPHLKCICDKLLVAYCICELIGMQLIPPHIRFRQNVVHTKHVFSIHVPMTLLHNTQSMHATAHHFQNLNRSYTSQHFE